MSNSSSSSNMIKLTKQEKTARHQQLQAEITIRSQKKKEERKAKRKADQEKRNREK